MRSKLYDFASQDADLGTFLTSPVFTLLMHKNIQSQCVMTGSQYDTKSPSWNITNLNRRKNQNLYFVAPASFVCLWSKTVKEKKEAKGDSAIKKYLKISWCERKQRIQLITDTIQTQHIHTLQTTDIFLE